MERDNDDDATRALAALWMPRRALYDAAQRAADNAERMAELIYAHARIARRDNHA